MRLKCTAGNVTLALLVADLMTLIQNNTVPVDSQELASRAPMALRHHRIWGYDDMRNICRNCPFSSIKRVYFQTWRESSNLRAPLPNNGFWDNDKCLGLWVNEHCSYELNRLSEAHFITQETTGIFGRCLALDEPFHACMLIR
jgi:hypothetical protein